MPTLGTKEQLALIEPYLVEYHSNGRARSIDEPLPTITTKDRVGLAEPVVLRDRTGKSWLLDIRLRMLQPHELAAAMSFPKDYKFTGTRAEQVKQIGNAVCVKTVAALITTILSSG